MITVHHLNNSRSHRVLWLLEELEADYEIVKYQRDPKTMLAPPELREIHPLGKSPVITDGRHTIAESGAILEYLVDKYEGFEDEKTRLRPARGAPEFLQYRYWMHYAEGSAMPSLLLKIVFEQLPAQGPWLAKPLLKVISKAAGTQFIDPQIRRHRLFWEQHLAEHAYFAGDQFSTADIQMIFPLLAAQSPAVEPLFAPKTQAYLEKIRQRPAYQRAMRRGGPIAW